MSVQSHSSDVETLLGRVGLAGQPSRPFRTTHIHSRKRMQVSEFISSEAEGGELRAALSPRSTTHCRCDTLSSYLI